ncbi:hypothetical protein [Jatrophihabitans sp.]|uniref:hypothetical protein n=1 Tax=Jatrophihabitans sp. TaxID=1932789 RepID=UPI002C95CDE3|nr:hypothetical protein [Jatrophihabitans sp.]
MNTRQLATGLGVLAVLLTGCASGGNSGSPAPDSTAMAGMSMAAGESMAGMTMAPGQSMAGMTMAPAANVPSEAAAMVCSQDIRDQVRTVLQLDAPAPVQSSWRDKLYTCSYTLPMGRMVLSVKESADKPAAREYFEGLRGQLGSTEPLLGLGEQAYATKTGIAVVLKDNMTLRVDTTGLPAVFGPQQQRRTDLAYEIASDVLGCWTGDGDE